MSCAENVKSVSMSGFGRNGAGCGADEEPFCGAGDAAPGGAAAGDAQRVVAFVGERGGFLAFIGEVVLGRGELCLASFAVDGEVVKRLQVFGGNDGIGLGRRGVLRCWWELQSDGGWKRNLAREFAHDLRRRYGCTFLGRQGGEGLGELSVAIVLPRIGRCQKLLGCGEFGSEMGTVALVRAPGEMDREGEQKRDCNFSETKPVS